MMKEQEQEQEQEQEKMKKQGFRDPIGDRMKEYEQTTVSYLVKEQSWIVRLDGHHFSKFTKGFTKPFDPRLASAMTKTACDLLTEFGPSLVYTQSDEITMVYPAIMANTVTTVSPEQQQQQQQIFGGKVTKITTLMASFCAVRFNFHIQAEEYSDDSESEVRLAKKVRSCMAYFDARAFNVPSETEAVNNVLWRSHVDCRRNSILNLGCAHFSPKQMHGWSTGEVYERLKTEKGVLWDTYPEAFKHGTFVKKDLFEKDGVDQKTGAAVKVVRTKVESRAFDLKGFSVSHKKLLFSKYWKDYDDEILQASQQDNGQQNHDNLVTKGGSDS
jgi:tRNA(His) guanylyltransferase